MAIHLRTLIGPLFFLLSMGISAQTNLDSLLGVWKNENLQDTVRAKALRSYVVRGPFRQQPDSAVPWAQQLYDFNSSIDYKIGMVDALNLKGYSHFRIGEYPEALQSYNQGLQLAEKIKDSTGAADILLRMGYVYHDNEDYLKALDFYQRSLKLYDETDDIDGKSGVYNEFGSIYRTQGDFDKALEYYLESIKINDSLGKPSSNAPMYNNIGNVYLDKEEYDRAIEYYEKALEIDYEKGSKITIASSLAGIGSAWLEKVDYKKALEFLEESLQISEEIKDIQGGVNTRLEIANIHIEKKEHAKAIKACLKSLSEAKQIGDIGNQELAYKLLYESYRALGKAGLALVSHEKMLALVDSVKREEMIIKLQQMEFAKQVLADSLAQVEKDLQIEMKHQEEVRRKDRNRNIAIGVGILFLILALGFFSRWRYVKKSRAIIEKEKNRSENLLLNILPAEIAEELKEKGEAEARDFDMVSILFTDFKGFTEQSAKVSAAELIAEINQCFKSFDLICEKYGVEKIKTIGDAYMAAGGLPVPSDESVLNTILAGLEMQAFMKNRSTEKKSVGELSFEMRLGIHTGPVVAGIVGVKKFQYDVWGDTVNTASRMESNGQVGKVNISQNTYELIKENPDFIFEPRGKIKAKGKGDIDMWFVESK